MSRALTRRKPTAARRHEIAEAALDLIAARGVAEFTAMGVARAVGLSDAALFRHFDSMESIVQEVIDRVDKILFAGFPPHDADPLVRLQRFFGHRVEIMRRHPGVARLVASDILATLAPPAAALQVRSFKRRSLEFIRACVVEARQKGRLEGLGVDEVCVLVVGSIHALTQRAWSMQPSPPSPALAARVWAALQRTFDAGRAGRVVIAATPAPRSGRRRRPRSTSR
ncbi:MAG: TetR/AcrR family transcriptional regulator [Deltaproteobacteria bacterium]|nr:TetR/AcrR family transcriptional regulator [Deltaproteobacteria bacterium]